MNTELSQLVKAATSGADAGQIQFAENIGRVLGGLAADVVRNQLVPFLTVWMPFNNRKAVGAIAGHIEEIAKAAGGLKPIAAVVEKVVAVEAPEIEEKVFSAVEKFKGDEMVDELISALVLSPFDCVRKFVVRVVGFASKDAVVEKTCETLVVDRAACVREAVARLLKSLKTETAMKLVPVLAKDAQSRVRGILVSSLYEQPYFFDLVATPLVADHDWSVRAALGTSLGESKEVAKAAPLCSRLAKDGVWQVKLCALRSLTRILKENPALEFSFGLPRELIDLLDAANRNPLKFAVIDCFFAQSKVDAASVDELFTRVLREPHEVKLRFLEEIAKRKEFASAVEDKIVKVVTDLADDKKQWRMRLGVVNVLKALADSMSQTATDSFSALCQQLIDDEAFLVRSAALKHLASIYLKQGETVPELFNTLKGSDSFRKRQAAIGLLKFMKEEAQTDAFKQTVDEQLKPLLDDPISNVSSVAKGVLNKSE